MATYNRDEMLPQREEVLQKWEIVRSGLSYYINTRENKANNPQYFTSNEDAI